MENFLEDLKLPSVEKNKKIKEIGNKKIAKIDNLGLSQNLGFMNFI